MTEEPTTHSNNPFAVRGRHWLENADDQGQAYLAQGWLSAASRALRRARQEAGLTQRDLAEKLGTKQSAIARWENDSNGSISLNNFVEFLNACGQMPYRMEYLDLAELREYELDQSLAPSTVSAVEAWRASRSAETQSEQVSPMPDLARNVGYLPSREEGQNGERETPELSWRKKSLTGLVLSRMLLDRAKQSHARGDVNRALEYIKEGLRELAEGVQELGDGAGKEGEVGDLTVELYYYSAEFLQDLRQCNKALQAINAAITRRQICGTFDEESVATADLFRSRASIHVGRGVDDDWTQAQLDYNTSFTHLGQITDESRKKKLEAKILTSSAWFHTRKGEFGMAESILVPRGLDVAEKGRREAYFLQVRAAAQRAIKADCSALYSEDAPQLVHRTQPGQDEPGGRREDNAKGWEQILQNGIKALEGFRKHEDWRNVAGAQIELAGVHTDWGRHVNDSEHFEVALWLAGEALRFSREMNIHFIELRARTQISETLAGAGRLDEARAQIELAQELTHGIEDRFQVAYTQKVAGSILRQIAERAQFADDRQVVASDANFLLGEALATFSALGAHGEEASTKAELERISSLLPESSAIPR